MMHLIKRWRAEERRGCMQRTLAYKQPLHAISDAFTFSSESIRTNWPLISVCTESLCLQCNVQRTSERMGVLTHVQHTWFPSAPANASRFTHWMESVNKGMAILKVFCHNAHQRSCVALPAWDLAQDDQKPNHTSWWEMHCSCLWNQVGNAD